MFSFASYAHSAETLIDRLRPRRGEGDLIVEPYIGYSIPHGVVVRGRILEAPTLNIIDRVLDNTGSAGVMISNFLTNEVAGVEISASGMVQYSDEEGYFSIELANEFANVDSVEVLLTKTGDRFELPVSQTQTSATHGIISDVDDTLLETGAWDIVRNLWTTFTVSSAERVIFDDTVALLRDRQNNKNPIFFVSSSPWNLHQYLLEVFKRANAPFGPIFLRDLGIDENKFIKGTHGSHKGDAIDTILAANPELNFILIGDTGQHDGEVYLDAIKRHRSQIVEVCLRNTGILNQRDAEIAKKIEATGVKFYSGTNFYPLVS